MGDGIRRGDEESPRLVLFFFESPVPFMLPDQTTWGFVLDDEIPWLEGIPRAAQPGTDFFPQDEVDGRSFVSFRFWHYERQVEPQFPSDELKATVKAILAEREDVIPGRLGIVGMGDHSDVPDGSDPASTDPRLAEIAAAVSESADADEPRLMQDVTVVEAVTPFLPSDRQSPVLEALQRCMDCLTEFSRVYRLATKVSMIPFTYEILPATGVLWLTRDPFDTTPTGWDPEVELLMFPERLAARTQHDMLDDEALGRLTVFWRLWREQHPLVPFSERTMDARLALERDGNYTSCVIQCQTAIEVVLDGLLQLLLWEEAIEPRAAAEEIFRDTLRKRVRTQFPPRLGGNWDTSGAGAIGRWGQFLAPLRNRSVHTAYRPSRDEALQALAVVSEVDDFFRERLVQNRNRYPRTTLMTLGQPGLERYGLWKGKIKRFAEGADSEPTWITSFAAWRNTLNRTREALD